MRVFELRTDPNRYRNFVLVHPERDAIIYDYFDGVPMSHQWGTPEVTVDDGDEGDVELGDFAWLGTVPVFSLRALEVLVEPLKSSGEVLPLRCKAGEYFAYNVTRVVPALNEAASSINRYSTGRVMEISKYAFLPDVIDDVAVFKIPQLPKAYVFVTDHFVEQVRTAQLTGFSFPLLWVSHMSEAEHGTKM
jgi:hypothetical protein